MEQLAFSFPEPTQAAPPSPFARLAQDNLDRTAILARLHALRQTTTKERQICGTDEVAAD
jgi:hypothetical protein